MWIWDQVQWEALVARAVSQEVGERQGSICVEEDGPSHLLMCCWAAWGHDLWNRKASPTWRCCQTTKNFAVLRAFPGYCYSLISQYFLLCVFSLLGWRPRTNLWGLPFPLQLDACLHHSCSGCSDTSSAGLGAAPHICCAHFCLPWGLDPSCITASAILSVGRRAPASNWPATSAPQAHAGNSVINLSLSCVFPEHN